MNNMDQALSRHRRPLPLGELLHSAGLVSEEQLDQAVLAQVRSGEPLGITLVRMGVLDAKDAAAAVTVHEELVTSLAWRGAGKTPGHGDYLPNCLKLGQLLLVRGEILRQELEQTLLSQSKTGHKLGELLMQKDFINAHQLADALIMQQRLRAALELMGVDIGSAPAPQPSRAASLSQVSRAHAPNA